MSENHINAIPNLKYRRFTQIHSINKIEEKKNFKNNFISQMKINKIIDFIDLVNDEDDFNDDDDKDKEKEKGVSLNLVLSNIILCFLSVC